MAKQDFSPDYAKKVIAWFEKNVFPWVGSTPIGELSARDFLRVLQRVEDRGAIESAHRIKQNCSQVMRYAVATGRAERDPTVDLKGALARPAERHHAAITDPKELAGLLRAIEGFTGTFIVKSALRLAPLVFVRPSELCGAGWSEIDLDAEQWNIPASRMKTGQPHLVPLSTQALAILTELHPLTGRGRYVFPSARTPHANASQRPMTTNALLAALQRIGYSGEQMTTHGFRATARTILDEHLGVRPDFIEHQLAHAVRDPNGRAYNRTAHLDERRGMMQKWADYLDALRDDTGKVVPFKTRAQS
jgi:integrase